MNSGTPVMYLDAERRCRLDVIASSQGLSNSDAVRSVIDRAYEEIR